MPFADDSLPPSGLNRREVLRRFGAVGALLAVPGLLAACGTDAESGTSAGATAQGSDAEIDSITWGIIGAIPSLDIASAFVSTAEQVQALGLEGLVGVGPDLKLVPGLAESWSQPDPLRYVYKIRPGVTFWDGAKLTADDVVASLTRYADAKGGSQLAGFYVNVTSIKATGPLEVTVRLKRPDALFQYIPSFSWIMPKAFLSRVGKQVGVSGPKVNVMGTGPFEITAYNADTGASLVRNDAYWGPKPRVRKAEIKILSDPQTLRLAMQSGDLAGVTEVPVDALREWERLREADLLFPPGGLVSVYLSLNAKIAPFDDVHVRRAIAHMIDGEALSKAFLGKAGTASESLVPRAQWGNLLDSAGVDAIYAKIPQYEYSVEAAKKELAQSAHPDGFRVSVDISTSQPTYAKALVSLKQTLKQIGITLDVNSVPESKWLAGIFAHEQPLIAMLLNPDYPDPANYASIALSSANAGANGLNTASFENARVDELLDRQNASTDKAERARLIGEVLRIAGEELPYVPIWWQASPAAVNSGYVLEGFNGLWYTRSWLRGLRAAA